MTDRIMDNKWLMIRVYYYFSLTLLLHCLFYVVYWFAVGNYRNGVDQFISNRISLTLPYTTLIIVLTAILGVWSMIRFLRLRLATRSGEWVPPIANWIYVAISVIFLVLFYASFIIILNVTPSQKGVLFHLLNLTRLVSDALLFLLAAIWLRRLILYLRRKMLLEVRRWPWAVGIIFVLVLLVVLWLVPAVFPPAWAYQGDMPPKPALIAHRGASMLAPENTLAAAELAANYQAFGFETDLRISLDGEPFLMHDVTLERTTNIAEVFPDRIKDSPSFFTLEDLKQLNAGLWFIQKDPFGTIDAGFVSQNQLSINQGQSIPTLTETLKLMEQTGLVILLDMRYPPEDHPYYDEFLDIVLTQCQESRLNSNIWFLLEWDEVEIVQEESPQITRVAGVSSSALAAPSALLELGYEIVNVDTGIRTGEVIAYRQQGLGVNVYTIDEPWLFSQFWLSGVTSVTTNNVQTFSQLDKPFLNLSYSRYILLWGLFGIIVAIWLASSQPEQPRVAEEPRQMETPDLMDFAVPDEDFEGIETPVENIEDTADLEDEQTAVNAEDA